MVFQRVLMCRHFANLLSRSSNYCLAFHGTRGTSQALRGSERHPKPLRCGFQDTNHSVMSDSACTSTTSIARWTNSGLILLNDFSSPRN